MERKEGEEENEQRETEGKRWGEQTTEERVKYDDLKKQGPGQRQRHGKQNRAGARLGSYHAQGKKGGLGPAGPIKGDIITPRSRPSQR